jgi:hypothetical protein
MVRHGFSGSTSFHPVTGSSGPHGAPFGGKALVQNVSGSLSNAALAVFPSAITRVLFTASTPRFVTYT